MKLLVVLSVVASLCPGIYAAEDGKAALAKLRENFCVAQMAAPTPVSWQRIEPGYKFDDHAELKDLAHFFDEQQPDGSWKDIDYTNDDRASWLPGRHASRVLRLAKAWRKGGADDPDRARCAKCIHAALAFWQKKDFQCPNWWWNRIGIPKTIGTAALLFEQELTKDEREYIANTLLKRAGFDMTGQNRVWLSGIEFMRGLLLNSSKLVEKAASTIWEELVVTMSEGVQPDFSFHQHGPQLQFGNYGLAYAGDMTRWLEIFRGTSFAAPTNKVAVLREYFDNGLAWTLWHGRMDASSFGRQFDFDSLETHGRAIASAMRSFDELDGVTNRVGPLGNRFFWRTDFAIHRTSDFMASLKMCSTRVIGAESLNGENLEGYFTGDGVLLTYRTGDEYENIFPLWDWRKLPGITAPQSPEPPPKFASYRLGSAFVGGVSDGTNGCAVLDYSRDGTVAKKSWFFLNDQIICLGTGISSTQSLPVATGVNQCWKRGEVKRDGDAILHDGIRYLALSETKFQLADSAVTGSWWRVRNTSVTPKTPVTGEVFSVWIDHGKKPSDAAYAYAVLPGAQKELMCQVLSNTTNIQSVADEHGNLLAVFYAADNLKYDGHSLTVDQPCVVFGQVSEKPHFLVADPSRKYGALNIAWDGHYHRILLPTKARSGASIAEDL